MKRQILIFMTLVSLCTLVFVSCNQEDDLWENVDLSINSQIPMTRSVSDSPNGNPQYPTIYETNKQTPRYTNECFFYALTEVWKSEKRDSYFQQSDIPTTASDFYENLKNKVKNDTAAYHWRENTEMQTSCFEKIGQSKKLIGEYIQFKNEGEMRSWLSNEDNRRQVAVLYMKTTIDRKSVGHYAAVDKVSDNHFTFTGYNCHNSDEWGGGSIYFETEYDKNNKPKEGKDRTKQDYSIIGVYLKYQEK